MGCSASKDNVEPSLPQAPPAEGPAPTGEQAKDLEIERTMAEDKKADGEKVKLLLLGTGESGKSTIFKQMRIIYGSERSEEELRMFGVIVRSNTVVAVRKLCRLLNQLGLERKLDEESAVATAADMDDVSGMTPRQAYDQIVAYLVDNTATTQFTEGSRETAQDWVGTSIRAGKAANYDAKLFLQHVEAIRVLWQSMTLKEVWLKRSQANINDSHKEYLSDLTRIASPNYIPTRQDILISRVRTTQINVEKYTIEGTEFEIYDVGGQRSERRKWVECFENVDAVIFVAALSEYDQNLAEAKRQNRMKEALSLFESVVKNVHFAETSIMLFLNKKDIFAEKILYTDISATSHFSDYAGPPGDFDHGVLYFIQKFEEHLDEDEFNDAFIHVTCATDTTNMEFVLDSSRTIIMTDNMRRAGFLGSD